MNAIDARRFWAGTSAAGRSALNATMTLFVVALGVFLAFTTMISVQRHVSPATAIFGPLPGNPMIVWLYWTLPCVGLQGAVALALRHRVTGLRIAGTASAFGIAFICLLALAAFGFDLVRWLTTGTTSGDLLDLAGEIMLGVPFALVIGGLNARAAWLSVHDLQAQRRKRRLSPLPSL
jgi:hypothetical protein